MSFFGDLKGLFITQLDDDDDNDNDKMEAPMEPMNVDEFDDDDEEEDCGSVLLGFVKRPETTWSYLRQVFPSLAGGVPAWLDPVNLPSGKSILCDLCEAPLQFLLQVYSVTDKESAFHRTLYLFMCPSMSCLLRDQHEQWKRAPEKAMRSIKIFRCQLPRVNPFYSIEAPKKNGTDKPLGHGAPLCTWCGTWKGDKLCSGCKNARYCSSKHQALHWRSGHKTECQQHGAVIETSVNNGLSLTEKPKVASKSLWKEFVLFTKDTEMTEDEGITNKALVSTKEVDEEMKSLMKDYEGDADENSFVNFQQCVAEDPEQVLRYRCSSDAKPLWPMASGRISESEIPNCKSCGGSLCFEFQVMPQLLFFFGAKNERDSLDWATIVVYTCEKSCESSLSYKEEFVWVQV